MGGGNMKPESIGVFRQPTKGCSWQPIVAVVNGGLRPTFKRLPRWLLLMLSFTSLTCLSLRAQTEGTGTVSGRVAGPDHVGLQGARVELQPKGLSAVSDSQGQFTISDVPAGSYTLSVSYIGFAPYSA